MFVGRSERQVSGIKPLLKANYPSRHEVGVGACLNAGVHMKIRSAWLASNSLLIRSLYYLTPEYVPRTILLQTCTTSADLLLTTLSLGSHKA